MRITRSRDGVYRASIAVHWRLDLEDVVLAVAHEIANDTNPGETRWSKRLIESATRSMMETHGNGWWVLREDLNDDQVLAAESIVLAHYPEFGR